MKKIFLIVFLAQSLAPSNVSAKAKGPEILFEGYYKILSDGQAIGYSVARYTFDHKKKQFGYSLFTKMAAMNVNSTESLQAFSKEDMTPLSYKYSLLNNADIKTIDAKIAKGKLTATVIEKNKKTIVKLDMPKGSFLSYFLIYVMLKSPKGIAEDTKYDYKALIEEDIKLEKGFAVVKSIEKYSGLDTFKVLNEFAGKKFINYITKTGQIIASRLPVEGLSVELVSQPSLATQSFPVPSSILKEIFGEVPEGSANMITQLSQQATAVSAPPQINSNVPGKQQGVPPGMGLQMKGK